MFHSTKNRRAVACSPGIVYSVGVMATARLNSEYARRMCGVGALLLALSGWSIYDGAVAWPRANAGIASVRPALVEACASGMTPEAWLAAPDGAAGTFPLKEVFDKAGRPLPRALVQELSEITYPTGDSADARRARADAAADLFSRDLYPEGKRRGQFVQAAVLAILAMLAFRAVWVKRGVEYSAGDDGLSGNGFGPAPIPWDEVESIDWSRWDSKGVIGVAAAGGRRFTLDGWHFKGVRDIAAELERRHPKPGGAR